MKYVKTEGLLISNGLNTKTKKPKIQNFHPKSNKRNNNTPTKEYRKNFGSMLIMVMVLRVYTYSKFLYINWISVKLKKTRGLVVGVEMDSQVFPNEEMRKKY